MTTFTGSCACGAVRYEIAAAPIVQVHCQCSKCQHFSGTGHGNHMVFPKAAATITGKLEGWSYRADSGNAATNRFCPICGTPVASETTGAPDIIAIHPGSLDDPSAFAPQLVVFAEKGNAWDRVDASLPKFPGMPPG